MVIAGADLLSVRGKCPGDPLLYDIAYVEPWHDLQTQGKAQILVTPGNRRDILVVRIP